MTRRLRKSIKIHLPDTLVRTSRHFFMISYCTKVRYEVPDLIIMKLGACVGKLCRTAAVLPPVKFFSQNLINIFLGYFDPVNMFFDNKNK